MNIPSHFRHNTLKLALATAVALGGTLTCTSVLAVEATTSATVVTPIAVTVGTHLNFGRFAAVSGGTVTLSTDSTRAKTSTVFLFSGVTAAAAKFNVTGDGTSTYAITVSNTALTHTDTTTTMPFVPFTEITPSVASSGTSVTAGALIAGAQSFYVGGVLTVADAQLAGVYSGTITATVAYN